MIKREMIYLRTDKVLGEDVEIKIYKALGALLYRFILFYFFIFYFLFSFLFFIFLLGCFLGVSFNSQGKAQPSQNFAFFHIDFVYIISHSQALTTNN
jgi:hypothetical protein